MGYFSHKHDDSSEEFETKSSVTEEDSGYSAEDDIEAVEEYILEQESEKAKKRERAILKIRHAIEDYKERKRLRDEIDYLSENGDEDK